jgi:uncharacterized membrane protein YoaK (UPF0700 family)
MRRLSAAATHPPLHVTVIGLTIVSGSLDAISLLALGDTFASVMTGNIVFMGVAVGMGNSALVAFSGTAIGGYIGGVLVGSWLSHRWRRDGEAGIWPGRVTRTLSVELAVGLALGVSWFLSGGEPNATARFGFLFGAAWLMGTQGAAVRAIGVPVSTTYMTGALTTLLEALVVRRPFTGTESTALTGLAALAVGALLGALCLSYARPIAWLVPIGALTLVVAVAAVSPKLRRSG